MTKIMLQIEGFSVLVLSLYLYAFNQFNWFLFFILLLVPDLSMLGYLINNKIGSVIYNIFHIYLLPFLLIIFGVGLSSSATSAVGLIWTAHIGMDRMVGYGLKYPTHFKDTHLDRV